MNHIQKLLRTKIKCLINSSNGYNAIEHNVTKGSLRERLLIDFFKDIIPSQFEVASGIICDAKGESSRQTDFIVFNKQILPSIFLTNKIAVIPVDCVYLIAEIKTTLRKKDLEQVKEAREAFNSLQLATMDTQNVKIPSVILAFKNEVAEDTLKKWLVDINDVVSICITGEFTLSKENTGVKCYKNSKNYPENWETLNFCRLLYNFLQNSDSINSRSYVPKWDAYLQGAEIFAKTNGLSII